jgi:hypothetical protein
MSRLPDTAASIEAMMAKQEAVDTVSGLIERNLELEAIFEALQPLLYELSVALYKDNDETITLNKLIAEGVQYIKGERQ